MQVCDACGGLMDVEYDLEGVALRDEGPPAERFFDLLPLLSRDAVIDGGEGNTPCIHARELGARLGLSNLWLKLEGANPTCTTKTARAAWAWAPCWRWASTSSSSGRSPGKYRNQPCCRSDSDVISFKCVPRRRHRRRSS